MSHEDLAGWHSRLFAEYENQDHYNPDVMALALARFAPESVVEIGGWRGESAAVMLDRVPSIASWTNYEVCMEAVENSVVSDPRYTAIAEARYDLSDRDDDAVVLSHVIEHMNQEQVENLLLSIKSRFIYIDCPLHPRRARSWNGNESMHVLQMSGERLKDLVVSTGFDLVGVDGPLGRIKWYERTTA